MNALWGARSQIFQAASNFGCWLAPVKSAESLERAESCANAVQQMDDAVMLEMQRINPAMIDRGWVGIGGGAIVKGGLTDGVAIVPLNSCCSI